MSNSLVLTAAGESRRMGGPVKKEYLTLSTGASGRISVLSSALHAFLETKLFSRIIITVPADGIETARTVLAEDYRIGPLLAEQNLTIGFVSGGPTRQSSVRNGLLALGKPATPEDIVLIHDGARPWISPRVIDAVIESTKNHGASVPAIPPVDTLKEISGDGQIVRHLERASLAAVQTPQGFRLEALLTAHERAEGDGREYTDDTEIWGRYAGEVHVCQGDPANRKITYQGDIA